MFSTTILPDFRKLKTFYPHLTEGQINQIEAQGGVPIHLDYMDEVEYYRVADGLKVVLDKYALTNHYTEILYLVLKKNEQIRERYDAYLLNYNDDLTSREVAKFLLAYKTSKPNQNFHLTAKSVTKTVTIKDSAISRWMAELIYNNIEEGNFPLGISGEKINYDLFGEDLNSKSISLERLEATANLKPRKPTVRVKKLYVEFCRYLKTYLVNQTHLIVPDNITLTDAHANFFFDTLELLGYLNADKIESEPKDYLHAMFRNNLT
jgi:hypothetical protein